MATIKTQNIQINAATTKPQTNSFSKYCTDNTKKFDKLYTNIRSIQQTVGKKNFCTYE
jgi:hypothetical protein